MSAIPSLRPDALVALAELSRFLRTFGLRASPLRAFLFGAA
jgi:hypothetical protein